MILRWWAGVLFAAPLLASGAQAQAIPERADLSAMGATLPGPALPGPALPGRALPALPGPAWLREARAVNGAGLPAFAQDSGRAPSIALATALSTALPGAGQYTLGQKRAWAYLALEAAGWVGWLNRRSAGSEARVAYRDFAWEVGRLQASARADGDFDYYETMSKWDRSGAFDADPGQSGLQPEGDPATFNGSIWSLATRLFPGEDGAEPRAEALEYYRARAYGSAQLWDWTAAPAGSRGVFGGLIEESDAGFRQATNVLGLILTNHVVAAIDAFLSARSRARIEMQVGEEAGVPKWGLELSVPIR